MITPNTMMWTDCSLLITIKTFCEDLATFVLWIHQLIVAKSILSVKKQKGKKPKNRKKRSCLVREDAWVCSNTDQPFHLFFMVCDKIVPFYFVWEISNIFLNYLSDNPTKKKLRHSYVPNYGFDWLAGVIGNHDLDLPPPHKIWVFF